MRICSPLSHVVQHLSSGCTCRIWSHLSHVVTLVTCSHMRSHFSRMGRYLHDVCTEGGVSQYVTNISDRLRECVTKGREGVQNPENFADITPMSKKFKE